MMQSVLEDLGSLSDWLDEIEFKGFWNVFYSLVMSERFKTIPWNVLRVTY